MQPIHRAPWEGHPSRRRSAPTDRADLYACHQCKQLFEVDDRAILAVPFRDLGERVVMGRELLVHESCGPVQSGLRVVGRGIHGEIMEGMKGQTQPGAGRHGRPDRSETRRGSMAERPDTMSVPVGEPADAPETPETMSVPRGPGDAPETPETMSVPVEEGADRPEAPDTMSVPVERERTARTP